MFSLWTPRRPEPEIYTTAIALCPAGTFKCQSSRFAFLRSCLSAPEAIVGEPLRQIAQSNFGSEFGGEPRQSIRAAPRTDAAGDADHNERIEGEAIAIVHASNVRFLFLIRQRRPPQRLAVSPVRFATNGGHSATAWRTAQIDPELPFTLNPMKGR